MLVSEVILKGLEGENQGDLGEDSTNVMMRTTRKPGQFDRPAFKIQFFANSIFYAYLGEYCLFVDCLKL